MIDTGLEGTVVLVTGANHGIGAATARTFAAQGARVLLSFLRVPATVSGDASVPGAARYEALRALPAEEVVRAIREQGGAAEAVEADLADPERAPRLFDAAESAFGPVEVLVNNAAHCMADTFLPASVLGASDTCAGGRLLRPVTGESHDQHFAVNCRAVALMMAEFARRHVARDAQWGRIVNISTDGASAFATEVSYGASKHALESYSRAAAVELGPYGITVNIVAPGPVQTDWIFPDLEAAVVPSIPLRRIGQPEEIADAILFLASHQARWITGQLLYVNGGHVMPL